MIANISFNASYGLIFSFYSEEKIKDMFDSEAIEKIRLHLIQNHLTIALAESVTAGLMQSAFASAEMASEFFQGGVTAYNIDQKVNLLKIDRKTGEECNCVSPEISEQMAAGAISLFKSDFGISITGYATPVPESDFRLYAYFTISKNGKKLLSDKLKGGDQKPLDVQIRYVNEILKKFAGII
jgi:nicotinamide-nucleotide amidase